MRKRRNLPSSSSSSSDSKKLECSRIYKRRRTNHENGDIISNLPEHILHYIFSFLHIKQAIQTCILSRIWRYFWVSLPTLNFNYTNNHTYKRRKILKNEFMTFVDRVLMFRGNSNIHSFVLKTHYCVDVIDRLNTWILASVIRNAQEITLDTDFPENFHLHHCLFTCKSLTKLVVRSHYNFVSISLPDPITLPRLRTLSLTEVKFEDEYSTNKIFSSCTVLESLIISFCEFPRINVNISSTQLQHLELLNCTTSSDASDLDPVDIKFHLCAPNLISFHFDNGMPIHCAPKNLSSLVRACINVPVDPKLSKPMYAPYLVNILRELHNVDDLTLSASFLEVVAGPPDLLDNQFMKFYNLRCLKLIGTWHLIDCIHAIPYLLKMSPKIETLSMEVGNAALDLLNMQPTQFCNVRFLKVHTFLLSRDRIDVIAYLLKICPKIETLSLMVNQRNSNSVNKRDYWEAGMSSVCLSNHLKHFEIRYIKGYINELEFIEILLKNAMLLEKLLIVFKNTCSVDAKRRQIKFSEKVFTFPRASSSVVIILKSVVSCQHGFQETPILVQ